MSLLVQSVYIETVKFVPGVTSVVISGTTMMHGESTAETPVILALKPLSTNSKRTDSVNNFFLFTLFTSSSSSLMRACMV